MSRTWLSWYLWGCAVLTLGAFWLIWLYAWRNTSGHTGVSLTAAVIFFVIMAITGILTRTALGKGLDARRPARLLILCGSLGAVFPFFLDWFHLLSPYETWLKAGQPVLSPQHDEWLLGYLSVVGLAVLTALVKPVHPTGDHTPDPAVPEDTNKA